MENCLVKPVEEKQTENKQKTALVWFYCHIEKEAGYSILQHFPLSFQKNPVGNCFIKLNFEVLFEMCKNPSLII